MTLEQLREDGDFDKPQEQAWNLLRAVLEDIENATLNALFQTPDGTTPQQSFSDICQGVDKIFNKFIDRLKDIIDKQVNCPEAREERLHKLAVSNANAKCKNFTRAFPLESEPTIQQMVEARSCLPTTEHTVALAVSKGVAEAFMAQNKQNMRCFRCSELGHL